jgi:23S rRNA pseudouridine1911/1915/1917 synthase
MAHRLDKETSGLLIVARTLPAHTRLVRMLEDRDIHREYEAICRGVMTAGGTVDAPIDRHRTDRVRMAIRDGGRDAVSHYRVIQRFRGHTHVRVQLETAAHQIRERRHIPYPRSSAIAYTVDDSHWPKAPANSLRTACDFPGRRCMPLACNGASVTLKPLRPFPLPDDMVHLLQRSPPTLEAAAK